MDVTDETELPFPNPWNPITSPIDLKHLGKFSEELSEAGAATARCIIQGIDEREPETGKLNREWLEDEIADVMANVELVSRHFGLDRRRMEERAARKFTYLRVWHSMLEPKQGA